ncbi:MAG: hypothetical protein KAQ62_14550 [Cyclobacteriaceae bacterium]|nr:hypothetical protein [Cyclobacteriaceae bacterium]
MKKISLNRIKRKCPSAKHEGCFLIYTFLPALILFWLSGCDKNSVLDSYPFPDEPVLFQYNPVDLSEVESFVPMGEPNVLPKDHGGFPLTDPYTLPANVPVFAVASGVIVVAGHGTRYMDYPDVPPELQGKSYDDYHLILQISKSVRVNYAHVSALNFSILPELEDLPADERGHNVEIIVNAGDILGWIGPHPAMDFSVTDYTLKLNFLNPSRYPESQLYAADIYNYFKEPQLSEMNNIAARSVPPLGGKVDYDIKGRIIGNWFLTGTTEFTQWSRQLAIVYDHLDANRIIISDGSPMKDVPGIEGPGRPDVWWVKGNTPAPETIGVGNGIIMYTLIYGGPIDDELKPVQGVMLVEMIDENSMRLEVFKGSIFEDAFTSEARVYER